MKSNKYKLSDVANKLSLLSTSNIPAKINEWKNKARKYLILPLGILLPYIFIFRKSWKRKLSVLINLKIQIYYTLIT